MEIKRIQPEIIEINGKIITFLMGEPIDRNGLSEEEITELQKFRLNDDLPKAFKIIREACLLYGIDFHAIMIRSREQWIVEPRQYAMFLLRKEEFTFQRIADIFGLNHATVIHGVRRIKDLMEINQLNIKK